jgi:hypothetical protein
MQEVKKSESAMTQEVFKTSTQRRASQMRNWDEKEIDML